MSTKEDIVTWLRKHWKVTLVGSIMLTVVAVTTSWAMHAKGWAWLGTVVLPLLNFVPISDWFKAAMEVIRLTPRQARLNVMERETQIQRLQSLDIEQRGNITAYLKTSIESVVYQKGISSTAPYVDICVRFYNLLKIPLQ